MRRASLIGALTRLALRPRTCKAYLSALVRSVRAQATYCALYDRFAAYTMIPRQTFVNNLQRVDEFRSVPACIVEYGVWRGGIITAIAALLGPDREDVTFDSVQGPPSA